MAAKSEEYALYWTAQISGWFCFIFLIFLQNFLQNNLSTGIIKVLLINFLMGIALSHFMRNIILARNWLRLSLSQAFSRIVGISFLFGILASLLYSSISDLFFTDIRPILVYPYRLLLQFFVSYPPVFLLWNLLYFAAYYLKNYEREEVKNLRLTATMNEIELKNLKSQLNPHFMFNALNSIRALIDENPQQAKTSITQLSFILRNTLMAGKKTFVTLEEELKTVEHYLDLEAIRFEERLQVHWNVDERSLKAPIPPLMIQTLAENAIKHGISKLPSGGVIRIGSALRDEDMLEVCVSNTGMLQLASAPGDTAGSTHIGMANSLKRLQLLYHRQAKIDLFEHEGEVHCRILVPFKSFNLYENHSD